MVPEAAGSNPVFHPDSKKLAVGGLFTLGFGCDCVQCVHPNKDENHFSDGILPVHFMFK